MAAVPLSRRMCTRAGRAGCGRAAVPGAAPARPGSGRAAAAAALWCQRNGHPGPWCPRRSSWSTGKGHGTTVGRAARPEQGEPLWGREVTPGTCSALGLALHLLSPLARGRARAHEQDELVCAAVPHHQTYPIHPTQLQTSPGSAGWPERCPWFGMDLKDHLVPRSCHGVTPTRPAPPNPAFHQIPLFSFCKFLTFLPAQEQEK